MEVFIQNGYPEKTVWGLLYQENKGNKAQQEELNMEKALYVPYHPRARRLYKILKKEFGYDTIFKKTLTLGDIILEKGRQIEKGDKKNIVYSIPYGPKEIRWPNYSVTK